MKKTCDYYLEKFYNLDKQERIPFGLCIHLLFCRECRSVVRNLTHAEKLLSEKAVHPARANTEIISAVLKGIKDTNLEYHGEKISLRKWAVSGSSLLFCIVLMITLLVMKGENTAFTVSTISLSVILCIWCGLFVGNNMDFFIKMSSKFHTEN